MVVKKAGGKIYGAVLTSAEKKAMNMENREAACGVHSEARGRAERDDSVCAP